MNHFLNCVNLNWPTLKPQCLGDKSWISHFQLNFTQLLRCIQDTDNTIYWRKIVVSSATLNTNYALHALNIKSRLYQNKRFKPSKRIPPGPGVFLSFLNITLLVSLRNGHLRYVPLTWERPFGCFGYGRQEKLPAQFLSPLSMKCWFRGRVPFWRFCILSIQGLPHFSLSLAIRQSLKYVFHILTFRFPTHRWNPTKRSAFRSWRKLLSSGLS